MPHSIMILAGEASGDMHGGAMATALSQLLPDARLFGMGGQAMRDAGVELLVDNRSIAVMGITEVLMKYPAIKRAQRTIERAMRSERPDLVILIDYVSFNLMVAKTAKACGAKVLFFIPPKIWAWKPERIHTMKQRVDHVATIFPFEVPLYEHANIPVRYVGNPLIDSTKPSGNREAIADKLGLQTDQPIIGLLPGSRSMELKKLMPLLMESAEKLHREDPQRQFVLPAAPSLDRQAIDDAVAACSATVHVMHGQSHDAMAVSDALIIASGTATLEAALIGTPMVVVYKVSNISYWIIKRKALIQNVSLVNIVAEKTVVKELLQDAASANAVCEEVKRMLKDTDYRQNMRNALTSIQHKLGDGGGAKNVAQYAVDILNG